MRKITVSWPVIGLMLFGAMVLVLGACEKPAEKPTEAHTAAEERASVPVPQQKPSPSQGTSLDTREVMDLQTALQSKGYDVEIDGYWGPNTRDAVAEFQRDNGLTPDGIVGPKTQEALSPQEASWLNTIMGQAPNVDDVWNYPFNSNE